MLRLRSLGGEVKNLEDDFRFIEIADLEGKLALLIYEDAEGTIILLKKEDQKFKDYVDLYELDQSDVVEIEEE